jgi:hypothetical protein
MNTTHPNRTHKIVELVGMLTLEAMHLNQSKNEPEAVNSILAMCEIVVSLPPEWFTREEQRLVLLMVKELYDHPTVFISHLRNDEISFYNKVAAEYGMRDLDNLVNTLHDLHEKEFGRTI